MNYLENINQIILPIREIEIVYKHLRYMGKNEYEGVALWAGHFENEEKFKITTTIIPKQKSSNIEDGLFYTVAGDELDAVNKYLYLNNLRLVAQIHSHPNRAYHSETDDKYPIVTQEGSFSIVVPNFAKDNFELSQWAIYRLKTFMVWYEITLNESNNIFKII
ncbi:MAG: Mov34/MPN/PAD-1 family protein [Bacteroidetes bacterium]|nr:Mov34/MPN/PAD-1 family protein [Bacteroidota bacterium]